MKALWRALLTLTFLSLPLALATRADAASGRPQVVIRPCGSACCVPVPDRLDSGDEFYGPEIWDWCRDDWINSMNAGFGVDRDYWAGHGRTPADQCNTDKPMARLYTGLIALTQTSPNPAWPNTADRSGNILRWGAGWAWDVIDDLLASCGEGKSAVATCTCRDFLGLVDFSITLWVPQFFYDQHVVERASTLMHEARHWNGKPHDSGSRDSSFGYGGAWAFEVAWLSWYAAEAVNAPLGEKCEAQDLANLYADTMFATDPNFRFDFVDCSGI
jgi:hypothetical protein